MKSRWVVALIYVALIICLIIIADGKETHNWFDFIRRLPFGDKIGHFCLMGGLSFVINWALACRRFALGRGRFLWGSAIVAGLVTLEEFSQLFVRYRTFDLTDLAADFAGIFLFGRLACWLTERRARRETA